jgi:hypothetical protein
MKSLEVPSPALCDLPLIETPCPASGKTSPAVNFKMRSNVLSMTAGYIPRLKLRHLVRRNETFEFPFHKS